MDEYKELYTVFIENIIKVGIPLLEEVCPKFYQEIIQNLVAIPFEKIRKNLGSNSWKIMVKDLYDKTIDLYCAGVLKQYYVQDEDAVKIVSFLTGLSVEELEVIKKDRYDRIRIRFNQLTDALTEAINDSPRESEEETKKPIIVNEEDLFGHAIKRLKERKKPEDDDPKNLKR